MSHQVLAVGRYPARSSVALSKALIEAAVSISEDSRLVAVTMISSSPLACRRRGQWDGSNTGQTTG